MFEKATRIKLRFDFKGQITTEDLWDIPVKSLNTMYSDMSKELKQNDNENGFLSKKNR